MDTATSPTARHFSDCFIKPKHLVEESKHPIYLSPWDLMHLSTHYMQFGLLFIKHSPFDINAFLESLKHALSVALVHFYPLAGQLVTENNEDGQNCCSIYIDCRKGNGARFIHATLDMTLSDILSPIDVPPVVGSFFDHDGAVSHDGHFRPLLSVQVTDLVDGVFMGCSMNHMVCDGSSYWHFLNLWSEILRAHAKGESISISRPPIHNRWFPEGCGPIFKLPFAHPEKFIGRYQAPQLRERIFHFSSQSLAKLKAKANAEYCNNTTSCSSNRVTMISSFQALSALVWRCVTQASRVHPDQRTFCWLAINDRPRLDPPVTEHYFGNMMFTVRGVTTAGALLERDLGWAAGLLHQAVVAHNSEEAHPDSTCIVMNLLDWGNHSQLSVGLAKGMMGKS
ncbi:hypothetical protein Ancab_001074 [Ancistrocladus abbreviatus]